MIKLELLVNKLCLVIFITFFFLKEFKLSSFTILIILIKCTKNVLKTKKNMIKTSNNQIIPGPRCSGENNRYQ